jgi:4-hydroxybenzoate polyprenyltransferase
MSECRGISHRRAVFVAYLKLPHALPIAVVMLVTAALTLIVDQDVARSRFAAILLSMLGAQLVIGVVNELVDLDLDRAARPDKPLVSGLVSERGALILLWVAIGLMIVGGGMLGWEALSICLVGCGIGVAYSVWFKRTAFASVPYLLALPLLPIWVAVALGEFDHVWLTAYPLGSAAILGVQIAQSVPDVATDKAAGIVSLTTFLGERRSLYLCWTTLSLSAIIVGLTGVARDAGRVAAVGVIAAVVGNVLIYRLRPRFGARFAFPVAATSTASLGVAWAIALTSS